MRCYLEIEQVRFGDRLTVHLSIEPATHSAQVPHLILQPVVENAIQHAIAPRASPGRIQIEAKRRDDRLRVELKDSGPGLTARSDSLPGHGVGLNNVRARLEQLYGADFSFEMINNADGGLTVLLEVPFQLEASDDSPRSP